MLCKLRYVDNQFTQNFKLWNNGYKSIRNIFLMDSFHIILEKWQEYEYLMDLKKIIEFF